MDSEHESIRLLYLTYNENVLESGILRSQVREMLAEMIRRSDIEYIRLLSFISPRLWMKRRHGFNRLVRELKEDGIDFRVRLMPAAQTWSWCAVPLFTATCLPVLLSHLRKDRFNVIHARGYGAGWLAYSGTRMFGTKFVFDPRGLFPEEMVLNGTWRKGGRTFRFWKALERKIIVGCDAVVALTPRFRRDYLALGSKKAIFAPSRLNVEPFASAAAETADNKRNLLFIGEMDSEWNSPVRVAMHFKRLKVVVPDLKLRLITRKDPRYVKQVLDAEGLDRADWTLESARPEEMPGRMAGSGIGLAMAFRPSGNWPMKYSEYLACGIPVAVEREIGEHITGPVQRWKLGIVLDETDPDNYSAVAEVLNNRAEYTERCIRYAQSKLDISHTSAQYARLYRELLKS